MRGNAFPSNICKSFLTLLNLMSIVNKITQDKVCHP